MSMSPIGGTIARCHLEILLMLGQKGMAGGTVLRAVAGFTGGSGVQRTSLVDADRLSKDDLNALMVKCFERTRKIPVQFFAFVSRNRENEAEIDPDAWRPQTPSDK
jgi:hypothetical protein